MKVTVIIPTYNRPDILSRLLQCLEAQQGGIIEEVLVCDDGSSTNTLEVIEPFCAKIPGLKLLRQDDLGFRAGQARNMGIRQAKGDLLIFIDDDVLLPQNFVAAHVEAHRIGGNGHPSKKVVLGYRFRTETAPSNLPPPPEAMAGCVPDDRIEQIGPGGEKLSGHPHPWFYVYSCNFSVHNDRQFVGFDERFVGWGMEDIELGYRLVRLGYQVVVQPEARVLHIESNLPRDPFICADRGLPPKYDSYIRNMVQFIDKYPEDRQVYDVLATDLRWYVRDEMRHCWAKDGKEHDPAEVIRQVHRLAGDNPAIGKGAAHPQGSTIQPVSSVTRNL